MIPSHAPRENLFRRWRLFAPLGLTLIGFGLSVVGNAVALKIANAELWEWFVHGTLGLVILNAGVAVFGEAVKNRALYEMRDSSDA
jgi:hypothetical protein